jgi:hypothetical protein
MSQFIESYFKTLIPPKKIKMKFYSHTYKNQWSVFPIPFVYLYFDTCHPESHRRLRDNPICGVYLSFNWLKWTFIVGFFKPIK